MVFKDVVKDLDVYFQQTSHEVASCFAFWSRKHNPPDRVEDYIIDLKKLVKDCGYKDLDRMVRDNIVLGIHEKIRIELCFIHLNLSATNTHSYTSGSVS